MNKFDELYEASINVNESDDPKVQKQLAKKLKDLQKLAAEIENAWGQPFLFDESGKHLDFDKLTKNWIKNLKTSD